MATAGLRERKKEKTHDTLVRTALRLFAKRGFDRVTVEDIATACEVSPRTFFRYFASKEDVLFAESDGRRGHLLASLADQSPEVTPFRALESAIRLVASDYVEDRDVLRVRHRIVGSTPTLRTRAAERQQGWEADVIAHLRASGRAKRMSDVDLRLLVAAATMALRVSVESWIANDGADDLDALLDTAFKRLHHGFDR